MKAIDIKRDTWQSRFNIFPIVCKSRILRIFQNSEHEFTVIQPIEDRNAVYSNNK